MSDLTNQISPYPFSIDWDRLNPREYENLCREFLSQMGFRRLDWEHRIPGIDLIGEFSRKDPDGFEYRDLWLISMKSRVPEAILITFNALPHYILPSIYKKYFSKGTDTTITLLLIILEDSRTEIDELQRFIESRQRLNNPVASIRFRVWDRAYLTSLVRQYPNLAYKYFSDEPRIMSKTRKSYEELYKENLNLSNRQAELIEKLQEEQNKRISAERDAVWKEISFSAAHKIGNPIFAIETDLDPLLKRIREQRTAEAEDVVSNIRSAVEKAKGFIEQFKSLAHAQAISSAPTALRPILEDAVRSLNNTDIQCTIDCPPELIIFADPERIAECFDELVANANHWFNKPTKKIEIKVLSPVPGPLPDFLDRNKTYALVHVSDNGCGIPLKDKTRIFDAFFTTYDHGTGLGLALVRRILEGHGGSILESGIPGEGADFQVYLPVFQEPVPRKKTHAPKKNKSKKE